MTPHLQWLEHPQTREFLLEIRKKMEELDAMVKNVASETVPEIQLRAALIESNTLQKVINFTTKQQYIGGKITTDNNTLESK
jgi:Fic family protein